MEKIGTTIDLTTLVAKSKVRKESKNSPYNPPIHQRCIAELRDDLLRRVGEVYQVDRVAGYAERLEVGDAELLESVMRGHIVYDHAEGAYYFWNNLYWEQDPGENIYQIAAALATTMYTRASAESYATMLEMERKAAADADPDEEITKRIKQLKRQAAVTRERAKALFRRSAVENALKFARATMALGISGNEWDSNPALLGVQNGVINLLTGQMMMPEAQQYIRTVAPAPYDPLARCSVWERSLLEIFDNDVEKVSYIKRFLGYALSGECSESDFVIWFGEDGRNGKEFILGLIRMTFGDKLAGVVESELLLKSKHGRSANGATEGLMALRGRRIAWASETNEGQQMDLARMKDLSGGHVMTGRHLHQNQVEWKRTHTLLLLTNHLPHVNSQSLAEWDRIKVVKFPLSFVNAPDPTKPNQRKKDKTLTERISKQELPGILNWVIQGGLEWRREGLCEPDSVARDTAMYKQGEDTLGHFIAESCVTDDSCSCKPAELYGAYKLWFDGKTPMGKQTFYGKIEGRGFCRSQGKGYEFFRGIGIKL